MPTWGLMLVAAAGLTVALSLAWMHDRRYLLPAATWFVAAGVAGVGVERFESGSLRSGLLVLALAYPALLLATWFRPGSMFAVMDAQQSHDAAARAAARRSGWMLTARLVVLAVIVAVIHQLL